MAKGSKYDRSSDGEDLEVVSVEEKVVKSKADVIRASSLPEHQKDKYLRDIGEIKGEEHDPSKVSFEVYAAVRKIKPGRHKAMLVYPGAKGKKQATLTEWDQIFKNF